VPISYSDSPGYFAALQPIANRTIHADMRQPDQRGHHSFVKGVCGVKIMVH